MSAKSLKRNYNIKTDYGNVFVRVWYTVQGETCGQSVMEFLGVSIKGSGFGEADGKNDRVDESLINVWKRILGKVSTGARRESLTSGFEDVHTTHKPMPKHKPTHKANFLQNLPDFFAK